MEELKHAVVRLSAEEAEHIVEKFEVGDLQNILPDEIHLLERYFVEHPEDEDLGKRYEEALRARGEAL